MKQFRVCIERHWEAVVDAEDDDAAFTAAMEGYDTTGDIWEHSIEEVENDQNDNR